MIYGRGRLAGRDFLGEKRIYAVDKPGNFIYFGASLPVSS